MWTPQKGSFTPDPAPHGTARFGTAPRVAGCGVNEPYDCAAAGEGAVADIKLAFQDADNNTDTDTDSDSPDTSKHRYVRYARFPREDPREEIARIGRNDV